MGPPPLSDGDHALGQQSVGDAGQHVLVPHPSPRALQHEGVAELVALDELGGVGGVRVVEQVVVVQAHLRQHRAT